MSIRSYSPGILVAALAGIGLLFALAPVGPAFAADDDHAASIPCTQISTAIKNAPEAERASLAVSAVVRKCHPLPDGIVTALRRGAWEDSAALIPSDRTSILAQATAGGYPEAETLAVRLIETGLWPSGQAVTPDAGAQLIRALKGELTTYRTHLLLDVYEQVKDPHVRQAVIQTLLASKSEEALLPALQAAYEETGPVQDAALSAIAAQPEKTPPALHARLIRTLPEGALLDWALRLAKGHPSDGVTAAKKARGIAG